VSAVATVEVRSANGSVLGRRELPDEVFGADINVALMHQVVVAGAAAQRSGTASTKTRAEVSGGGVKPWRQKGTGRARQGSIRSPQWMGGGISHGPKPRGYEMRVNKKMKKGALRSALADTAASGKLAVVDTLSFEEPRTKDAMALVTALELDGRVLLVLPEGDEVIEKSFRNLAWIKVTYPRNLSTYDLLRADRVLFTTGSLDMLTGETTEVQEVASEPDEPEETEVEPPALAEPEEPAAEPEDAAAEPADAAALTDPQEVGE